MSQWVDPEAPPPSYQPDGKFQTYAVPVQQTNNFEINVNVPADNTTIYVSDNTTVVRRNDEAGCNVGFCLGCMCAVCCCGCVVM